LFEVHEMRFEPERIIDGGETVVATVKLTVRGKRSGAEAINHLTHVWQVKDGLLASVDAHTSEAEALEAVGLRE
jgi:ketosteroid isomerase-like protein